MPHKNLYPSRSIHVRVALCVLIISAAILSFAPAFTRLNVLAQGDDAAADTGGVQPYAEFVRQLSLSANDVIYNPADKMLYASVPSSAGATGNTVVSIDPATGETGAPVFVGSEPGKLAMSDDGHTLYISLEGSNAIRRFDTATRAAGQQFSLGAHSFFGHYIANDLAVAPGNPNLVAVARHYPGTSPPEAGVAVFDNGVQRPKTGPDHSNGADFLAFSATESKLYGGGYYAGLRTMTVDASGVSATSYTNFSVGSRIKFAGGLVYSSTGQVVNPDTSTLLGTFSGVSTNAFAVDVNAGRAYFLTRDSFSNNAFTLKAFDLTTYVPVGSATLSGITGEPTTLVRWGANGLALRTDAGKLYLIQTSLIPSSEAIPTPTPTPSATATPTPAPVPIFVRQIPLAVNEIVYSPRTQQLYLSVPSAVGAKGNSVTQLNPETGEIGASIFVGSEPTRLVLADDGQTMYVNLSGANAVRKLDAAAQTAGLQFSLGLGNSSSPSISSDIAVMPGSPGTIAVSKSTGVVALYDEGVQRGQAANAPGPVHFASSTRLYAGGNPVYKMEVGSNGLTTLVSYKTSGYGQTQLVNGLLYFAGGVVVDPETGVLKGRFSGLGSDTVMAIDAAKNRAFFLTNNFSGSGWTLRSYELDTFRPVASVPIQLNFSSIGLSGASSLVRWGRNGLAFRTFDRIYLLQTALVDASETIPAPTPTPSATPTPTPPYFATVINKVNLPANDLVISEATGMLYASVPSSAGGASGNTITSVDPTNGQIGTSTFIGSEPNKLAISDDGQVLYAYLDGAKAARRFDIATKTPGVQFGVGVDKPSDMEVVPGSPQSLAVSRGTGSFSPNAGVAVYDNGVQRPNASNGGAYGIAAIEFGDAPSTLYGFDSYFSSYEVVKFELDASGVKPAALINNLFSGYSSGMEFAGGRLYTSGGQIADPEGRALVGRFNSGGSAMLIDQKLGRAFFLSNGSTGSGSSVVLTAYDINTFLPLGSVALPEVFGTPTGLVRWGKDGLAFCTLPNIFNAPGSTSQIYLLRSALVSDSESIRSTVQFSSASYSTSEFAGAPGAVVTVTRMGGATGVVTVNYSTGGGTATPGSDYTPRSGTLTFASGETTKTFSVPITDDNVYEGATRETIGLTLSALTGDATLSAPTTATIHIQDNDSRPSIVPVNMSVVEGETGTTDKQFVVRLSGASFETISINYATGGGTATPGTDYVATSGTLTFQPGETEKSLTVQIKGDAVEEADEQFLINFSNPVNVNLFGGSGSVIIVDDDKPFIQFSAPNFTASEGDGRAVITVTRSGATTRQASVSYAAIDDTRAIRCDDNAASGGAAFARCDYATTFDVLVFAPGEKEKTFNIPLVDDGHVEPKEFVNLRLSSVTGATLGQQAFVPLYITDNDAASQPNPVDDHAFFVRQHYLDFLSREPEADGLAAWTGVLGRCPDVHNRDEKSPSVECDRMTVSAAFFRSQEFQLKGYFVYRFYRVGFNRLPSYTEFVTDMRRVTGQTPEEVYARRLAFSDAWVTRPEFQSLYGQKNNADFVDSLLGRYQLSAINTPDPSRPDGDVLVRLTRDELVAALNAQRLTRAQVFRALIESREIDATEYNGAFVAMQYYGYLRRTPEEDGYQAWLRVLNRGDGYRVMVNGFMNSTEYRLRFGN